MPLALQTPKANPRKTPAAFVTTAVIMMLLLVSAAVFALSLLFATEARRTHSTTAGAQLRHLLLAAEPVALDELARNGPAPRDITVPTPVPSTTLTLHMISAPENAARIKVVVRSQNDTASQTLTFTRTAAGWQFQSATLGFQP